MLLMLYNRDQLTEILRDNVCEVTFTKVDGSVRVMPCTLKENIIPKKPVDIASKSSEKRLRTMDVLSAWCMDKQEWRSFRVANVIQVEIQNGVNG
jgi:hypothetical protein